MFGHTSVKVFAAVVVEVVNIDQENFMIRCSQMAAIQVRDFLHYYVGGCVLFLLVTCVGIPGTHRILIPFTYPPPLSLVG